MNELVDFLTARLDEDRSTARKCLSTNVQASMLAGEPPPPWAYHADGKIVSQDRNHTLRATTWPTEGAHITRHDPRRVLREVAVKQSLLELHNPVTSLTDDVECQHCAELCHSQSGLNCSSPEAPYPCPTVRLLVLPYADHADYREEWAP